MGQSNVVLRATTEFFFKELAKYVRNDYKQVKVQVRSS